MYVCLLAKYSIGDLFHIWKKKIFVKLACGAQMLFKSRSFQIILYIYKIYSKNDLDYIFTFLKHMNTCLKNFKLYI